VTLTVPPLGIVLFAPAAERAATAP
jgi:hypothetical protein